jgi:hypothetical protein
LDCLVEKKRDFVGVKRRFKEKNQKTTPPTQSIFEQIAFFCAVPIVF